MHEDFQIHVVHVEFLRPGPPHNQLLSPLTQYLAISGNTGAGVVTVPYEQATFERRLRELRYETGDPGDRLAMLHETGGEIGNILGSVPGLPGALEIAPSQRDTLVHLRLTLSASELAYLPFEIAKSPVSPTATTDSWLSIQTRPPVCMTRNIRTVSPEGVVWPDRPSILFISGNRDDVPFADHRDALEKVIAPFRYPHADEPVIDGRCVRFGDLLTILENPTISEVLEEWHRGEYTHVHILAHGDLVETSRNNYGIVLRDQDGEQAVVSGGQLASVFSSVGKRRIHRPTVVTVASCDSANVGTLAIPGASFAHALHQSGIPLVVASQFPLSKEGSILLAELYDDLLWGEHPLVLLQRLRAKLYALYTSSWHDWASLVVYEALPQVLTSQLDALRYAQAKRAINAVLERVDLAVRKPTEQERRQSLEGLDQRIQQAVERLPLSGRYGVECIGIRASSRKRLAEAAFKLSGQGALGASWDDPYQLLDQAWDDYAQAARGLLVIESNDRQRVATLHWLLVQVESLSLVLGRPRDEARWQAAALSADLHLDHSSAEERAWAHGSLAELWLIRLGEPLLADAPRKEYSAHAIRHTKELDRIYQRTDEFPIKSTRRQLERYAGWWNTPQFRKHLSRDAGRSPWDGESGLAETAKQMVEILRRERLTARPRRARPSTGNGGTPPAPAGAPDGSGPDPGGSPPAAPPAAPAKSLRPSPAARPPAGAAFFNIEMLPAGHGDSLWIEYGDAAATQRWLVDCGTQQTVRTLLHRVESVPAAERRLELFVLSHIDSDHIGGAVPFFKAMRQGLTIGDVWFNGWRHISQQLGARQGEMFSTAIQDFQLNWNVWRDGSAIVVDGDELPTHELPGGMQLTLLSPTPAQLKKLAPVWTRELKRYGLEPGSRVDYSRMLKAPASTSTDVEALADAVFTGDAGAPNGTSIAVLAEFGGASALLAADAHAPVLIASIQKLLARRNVKRLKLDAFKVSHHGSQNNVSRELIQLLDCPRYLVSTNGNHFSHPDRQGVARILVDGKYLGSRPALHFNYRSAYNEVWARPDLQEKYGYSTHYPEAGSAGTTVALLPR